MTVTLKVDSNLLKTKLANLKQVKHKAMPQIYQEFVKNTPVAPVNGGNARANTNLREDTIEANYPYADVLDKGRGFHDGQMRGSEQAPKGMSEPTINFAKKLIPQLIQSIARRR
jgi:hypothetical protein